MNSRYSRHLALIGDAGQEILLDSKVLVIGAGGLGSPLLYYLSAAGIGTIGIVDFDKVSLSDLQRQILYDTNMINGYKADQAKETLTKLNPDCHIMSYKFPIEKQLDIIDDFDLVVECSDNFSTKFLLNKECHLRKKPLVLGAVIGFKGYAGLFTSYLGNKYPCYQCFCPEVPDSDDNLQSCATVGVLNSAAGIVGSIQATLVIKKLLHFDVNANQSLIRIDTLNNLFTNSEIMVDQECPVCKT